MSYDLLRELRDQGWMGEALCAQTDPEMFFPEKGGTSRPAKAVCAMCPVSAECLEYALARGDRYGIWGGISERGRRSLGGLTGESHEPAQEPA